MHSAPPPSSSPRLCLRTHDTLRPFTHRAERRPTYEGSDAGGWSGPCESWWETSNSPFNAMRVCRVTTYLIQGFQKTPDWTIARSAANQLFRICWGRFPRSGSLSCEVSNAWAIPRGWTAKTGYRAPIVITVQATED